VNHTRRGGSRHHAIVAPCHQAFAAVYYRPVIFFPGAPQLSSERAQIRLTYRLVETAPEV
jgi:hypothetical protein